MKYSITVTEIKGTCPVYKIGDTIVVKGAEIERDTTGGLCIHALPVLLHFLMALREGADPVKLGLAKEGKTAYVQCPDPGEPYTNGGTVLFKIEKVE